LNATKLKPWPSLNKCTDCELVYHKDNMTFVIDVVCIMIIFLNENFRIKNLDVEVQILKYINYLAFVCQNYLGTMILYTHNEVSRREGGF
jgi:hypothetical protein